MQQLQDEDCKTRMPALTVLSNTLCQVDRQTAIPVALQLVEMLLPLFENVRWQESRGSFTTPGRGAGVHGLGLVCPSVRVPTGP